MERRMSVWCVALVVTMFVVGGPAYGDVDEVERLLGLMPADAPVGMVLVNLQKLDRSVMSFLKRIDPDTASAGPLKDIKGEFAIGEWIDFSKPVGVVAANLSGPTSRWAMLAYVPDFSAKVKTWPNARQEDGLWHLVGDPNEELYVRQRGDHVVVAKTKASLEMATKEGKSLAAEMKPRLELLRGRDLLLHVNMDPLRERALAGLAQAAQMAPGIMMMLGPQMGGGDPMVLSRIVGGAIEGFEKFVRQLAYLDIVLSMGAQAADVTITTGYREGAIKDYLSRQRPASVTLLSEIEAQPYFFAAGYHMPGDNSPFVDYVFEKLFAAFETPGTTASGQQTASTADQPKMADALDIAREMYRKIEGLNVVMGMARVGMTVSGDYLSRDPQRLLDLTKQYMVKVNPLMSRFGGGVTYESLGSRTIGSTRVEEFVMTYDKSNPAMAQAAAMYGEQARSVWGVTAGRLRFCMGDDTMMARVFGGKVTNPFADARYVKESLANLPKRRNAVMVVDPAGFVALMHRITGETDPIAIPPGPPVAVSVSLAGEPARVDIHIPLRSIERAVQASGPPEPM